MSLLFMEGFESLGTTGSSGTAIGAAVMRRWPSSAYYTLTNAALVSNDIADGGLGLVWGTAYGLIAQYIRFALPSQYGKTVTFGYRIKPSQGNHSSRYLIRWESIALSQAYRLNIENCTNLIYNDGTGTITVNSALTPQVWQYLEIEVYFHNSAGTVKAWVNDILIIDASGRNTCNPQETTFVEFNPGMHVSTYPPAMDDVYILNNEGTLNTSRLGKDARIRYYKPSGNGSSTDFTKSSVVDTYSAHVNDTPEDDTKYLTSATAGHKQLFTMEQPPVGNIKGVQVQSFITPQNPGTVAGFRHIVKSSVTTGNQPAKYEIHPAALEVFNKDIVERDPNTNAQWAVGDLDDAEFGVEVQ